MHDIGRTQLESIPSSFAGLELGEGEAPFNETQEIELAAELLEVASEAELEQFLGSLIRRAGAAAGRFVRSDTGRALLGILKSGARQALPIVGRAAAGMISPSLGAHGARWASQAGRLLGLELEGLSPEDKEFEVARQFIRYAGAAVNNACKVPASTSPQVAAQMGTTSAARVFAPRLIPRLRGRSTRNWPRSGRWMRQGRAIVIFGG